MLTQIPCRMNVAQRGEGSLAVPSGFRAARQAFAEQIESVWSNAESRRELYMWQKPVVEIRVEEYERGTLPELTALYKEFALPAMLRHCGAPINFYVPNVGRINCVTQLWAYESLSDYDRKQAAIADDLSWQQYLRAADGIVRYRENRLTRRISFPGIDQLPNVATTKRVVDFRTYLIHFNKMPRFIETTEQHAMKVMVRHIGPPLGYYMTTVGNLQQITHVWGFDSMGDMETRRLARNADPEWKNYLDASHGIYERQETQVLLRMNLFDGA